MSICARDPGGLSEAVDRLGREGLTVHPYVVDVTDTAQLEATVVQAATEQGGLDLVVANAGGSRGGGLQTSTAEDWMYTLNVNVVHAATAIRAAVPWLSASGRGRRAGDRVDQRLEASGELVVRRREGRRDPPGARRSPSSWLASGSG